MYDNKVIDRLENEYGSFTVEELTYEGRQARVLFSGPGHTAQSGIALDDNPRLLFDYNQRFLAIAAQLNPSRILVLGGGTLTLPLALTRFLPRARVTAVEINSDLIKLATKYFGYKHDARIKVVETDAYRYMLKANPAFELIITDIFDAAAIPAMFLSRRFAANLKRALLPQGIVATNCIAAAGGEGADVLRKMTDSYKSEIGPVRVVKADPKYADIIPQNLIVISGEKAARLLTGTGEEHYI